MPSPVGHALTGLVTAWVLAPAAPRSHAGSWPQRLVAGLGGGLAVTCGMLAATPDLDILVNSHRTFTHSLGAALIAGVAAAFLARLWRLPAARTGVVCGAAYASHVVLDWLGMDSANPHGIMVLWPISSAFYTSGADLFMEISRRYWKPDEFIAGNLTSIAWELLLLGPIAAVAWWAWVRRRSPES